MAVPSSFRLLLAGIAVMTLSAGCAKHAPVAAAASPCPPWVDYPADMHSNDPSPYLGCANRVNLDEMLDDKHDLVAGRKLGPANGERESRAVKAYEEGKTKTAPSGGASAGPSILFQGGSSTGGQ